MISKTTINKIFVTLLLIISTGLVFYKFNLIPKNLSFDEVEFAKLALSLKNTSYTPYSTLATGHSTLYFYIILLSFNLFGITNFALRLPAAIFGVLNVLLLYFVLKKSFQLIHNSGEIITSEVIPFILSLVFITMHWYLNFARFSFEATFLLFLELTAILFLLIHWNKSVEKLNLSTQLDLILAGLFTGLAYLSYTPGRLFFVVPLVMIAMMKSTIQSKMRSIILFMIPFILIILPLTLYLFSHPDIRVNQLSYLNNNRLSLNEKLGDLGSNVISTAGMFTYKGDLNGRQNYPGKPALNIILGLLFMAGLVITIKDWRKKPNRVFLLYFIISLIPSLLTYPQENPHMLRTFTAIPSVVFFIGTAFIFFSTIQIKKTLFWSVVAVLLVISTVYELRTYFVYQAQVFPQAFEKKGDLVKYIEP